jgi:hypothetical protein
MHLRQITYFVALFEEGSVIRAAQRVNVVLHLSQRPVMAASTRFLDVLGEKSRDMSPRLQAIIDGEV